MPSSGWFWLAIAPWGSTMFGRTFPTMRQDPPIRIGSVQWCRVNKTKSVGVWVKQNWCLWVYGCLVCYVYVTMWVKIIISMCSVCCVYKQKKDRTIMTHTSSLGFVAVPSKEAKAEAIWVRLLWQSPNAKSTPSAKEGAWARSREG